MLLSEAITPWTAEMQLNSKNTALYIVILFCILNFLDAFAQPNIYQYTQANMLSPSTTNALKRVYVPNGESGTVSVIDPATYQVIDIYATGRDPQHVVPSYDLQTLWVLNNKSNSLTPIDPTTGKPGKNVPVDDPYNLYFTLDGKYAIVVCEARKQLQLHDPKTMKFISSIPTQCGGANHMEFTLDGKYAIVTCEYAGKLMKVDIDNKKVVGYLSLVVKPVKRNESELLSDVVISKDGKFVLNVNNDTCSQPSMPQDIRSAADGKIFYVADMMRDGVVLIDPIRFTEIGFIPTSVGTHAIYPSRDGKLFYVSNRGCHHMMGCAAHGPGSISVIDPTKKAVIATWDIPQGGSPDMGGVTADGKELWLSGRYDREVYVFDTIAGKLSHRIAVGNGPHGLAVWPQPGRFSLGHTGNMR